MKQIEIAFHVTVILFCSVFIIAYSVDLIYGWKERRRIRKILEESRKNE